MPTQIQIKRGSTTPSGLTVGEQAVNTSTNQIYIGGTGGTVWVGGVVTAGVDMGAGSAVSANQIPTQSGVYNYTRNNFVSSFNGATGAVQGVSSAVAGTGISVSGATGAVTITNIGVQSFNGNTGAVTGASLGANTFTGLQTLNAGLTTQFIYASTGSTFNSTLQVNSGVTLASTLDVTGVARFAAGVTISGTLNGTTATFSRLLTGTTATFSTTVNTNNITAISTLAPLIISGNNGGVRIKEWDNLNANPIIIDTPNPIYIGDYQGIDTGLSVAIDPTNATVDFGNMTLNNANSYGFVNGEYIRNSTNGQVDIMPTPHGSTAYGMYFDMTSWSYGVVMGTINSLGQKNTNGYFRFDVPLTINNDTLFQIGSDGHYSLYRSSTGNDTGQLRTNCDGSQNSGAWALVGNTDYGTANRSPATKHTNPNLYIYANGTVSANDFIRTEHDRTNANIVTGGTSGIFMQPGSGTVGVSGGVSADAFILAGGGIKALTGTTYSFLATDNGKILTMSNAGGITAAIPTGLPVGFSVTVIQLGAGQVGFSADAGVTLNSYNSLKKIVGQHGSASVVIYSSNTANLAGSLT